MTWLLMVWMLASGSPTVVASYMSEEACADAGKAFIAKASRGNFACVPVPPIEAR